MKGLLTKLGATLPQALCRTTYIRREVKDEFDTFLKHAGQVNATSPIDHR